MLRNVDHYFQQSPPVVVDYLAIASGMHNVAALPNVLEVDWVNDVAVALLPSEQLLLR